jgi:hypothetical protein
MAPSIIKCQKRCHKRGARPKEVPGRKSHSTPQQLLVKVINDTIIPGTLEHVEQEKEDK